MNNPTTHTTTTSTTATPAKPTAMEKVKEKATHLADKLSGRTHDSSNVYHDDSNQPGPGFHGNAPNPANPAATYHAGLHPVDALHSSDTRHNYNTNQTTMPLHTGAAVGDTAVPHGNTVNRSAYQQNLDSNAGGGLAPAVPPKDDDRSHHHGIFGAHHDKHNQDHSTALADSNAADPNLIHPSVIPHQQTTNVAGPTGTSHVPAYNQSNIAPIAAGGAVPITAQTADQGVYPSSTTAGPGSHGLTGHNDQHSLNHVHAQMANMPGNTTTTAAGTQVPMNANNSTVPVNQHNLNQAVPVNSNNNAAVPAMGAPGTTTAAGTHMPGQYVA
ncbi:hypothetical protein BGW39_002726 [Mortierella sp. 14UC]|nr:hypothetical protein BGW39_002726 [Mortierella sp. 14UC]